MAKIRAAELSDYDAVMERCAASFSEDNPTHLRFQDLYPDSIQPTAASMAQWLVAEQGGEIAAGMQIVPRPMVYAGIGEIPAAGLGNVFCYPPFRGKGLMSTLLHTAISLMEERQYAVCLLGGDRLRYGHFGWENAGNLRSVTLGSNMLRFDKRPRVSVTSLRRWQGAAGDTKRMFEAYCAKPTRSVRDFDEFVRLRRRPGQVVWISEAEGGFAYAALRDSQIAEYAGDPGAFDRLARFLASRRHFSAALPAVEIESELDRILLKYAAAFSVNTIGMARIIRLDRLFSAWRPLLERRLAGWNGAVTLEIPDAGQRLTCRGAAGELLVSQADAPETITVDLRDAARLLFGPFPPAGPFLESEFVRRALPLPLYWEPLAHV